MSFKPPFKLKKRFLFVLIVFFIFLIFYGSKNIISLVSFPIERSFSTLTDLPKKVFVCFIGKEDLQKSLNEKDIQIQKLKLEITNLEFLKRENEILRKYLQFKTDYGIHKVTIARVISYSPDNWIKTFKIDVGEKDGVKRGDLVVYDGSLVGMVDKVFPSFSIVLAVNDKNFKITVRTKKTGESCLYQGFDEKNGYLKYVKPDQDIRIGDVILTETVSENIPSGIPVGIVKNISQKEGEFFRNIQISLMYRYTVLDYVMVISR